MSNFFNDIPDGAGRPTNGGESRGSAGGQSQEGGGGARSGDSPESIGGAVPGESFESRDGAGGESHEGGGGAGPGESFESRDGAGGGSANGQIPGDSFESRGSAGGQSQADAGDSSGPGDSPESIGGAVPGESFESRDGAGGESHEGGGSAGPGESFESRDGAGGGSANGQIPGDGGRPSGVPAHYKGRRFYSADTWLRRRFGRKTIKLAVDGGFTCPNRDGSKGTGGCTFCSESGSGEFASSIDRQIELYRRKWPNANYLAYFQNHTGTYAPPAALREIYSKALSDERISGLVIGTRPDCLSGGVMSVLEEINEDHFMWLELGLQTVHDGTAAAINRCYPTSVFDSAAEELASRRIKYVVHLILGLPGETTDMMLASVRHAASAPGVFGIKLHLLNVVRGSEMERTHPDYVPFGSIDEYVDTVVRCLEVIPPGVTIHRLTGDAPRPILINPPWSFNKRTILNRIDEQLSLRDTWQGKKAFPGV